MPEEPFFIKALELSIMEPLVAVHLLGTQMQSQPAIAKGLTRNFKQRLAAVVLSKADKFYIGSRI